MATNTHTTPRDFFLHLLHIITLYGSAIALISILWQVINIAFPDATEGGYRFYSINGAVRWGIAILVVMFPVLLGTGRFLEKVYEKEPEKRELKIRKWLIYFTLFAAAIIIIIDLVRLIFEFLGGELTPRFIFKFLSVLVIAAAIFWYYLQSVRKTPWPYKPFGLPAKKIFVWKTIIFVLAAIVVGILLIDSPADERAYKRDDKRVQDLQVLQERVISHWREATSTLPASLNEPLQDPATGEIYQYEVRGKNAFALCAVFEKETRGKGEYPYPERPMPVPVDFSAKGGRSSRGLSPERSASGGEKPEPQYYIENSDWTHEAGEVCFERKIIMSTTSL